MTISASFLTKPRDERPNRCTDMGYARIECRFHDIPKKERDPQICSPFAVNRTTPRIVTQATGKGAETGLGAEGATNSKLRDPKVEWDVT